MTVRPVKGRGKAAATRRARDGAAETPEQRALRALRIVDGLGELYADADCALVHSTSLELLVATILSAQCTDERVNLVTPLLFRRYPTARDYADASLEQIQALIRSTGFFHNKAKSLVGLGRALVERHGGEVPDRMEDLVRLPGVGRKTANVLLGTWFSQAAIPVDTHVTRLSSRLGLTAEHDPVKIELDLQRLLPRERWTFFSHALIWHGRRVCKARTPACDRCSLRPNCPFPAL